jgi:hypothetical protein
MEFKQIYELADKYEEEGLNLRQFLQHAESLHQRGYHTMRELGRLSTDYMLSSDLHMHHTIEEVHVFPVLATRMPEFKQDTGSHLKQRKNRYITSACRAFVLTIYSKLYR